mgnify:CR=1 FL=1
MVVSYESLKRELNIEEAKLRSSLEKLELENETLKIREKQLKEPLTAGVDGVVVGIRCTGRKCNTTWREITRLYLQLVEIE